MLHWKKKKPKRKGCALHVQDTGWAGKGSSQEDVMNLGTKIRASDIPSEISLSLKT